MTAHEPGSARPRYIAGIDVGGTFTDVFYVDETTGRLGTAKVPSNRADRARGCVDGLMAGVGDVAQIGCVVHGTTVGTNALLERRGARVGMITTRGFRDVLELRRRDRPSTWRLWGDYTPIVSRDLIVEVDERTLASGKVLQPVDPYDVRNAAQVLRDRGAEALCIVLVNAYANSANERAAVEAARAVWPTPHVMASSEILPEIREFERASTTALNSYLQPVLSQYLQRIEETLAKEGGDAEVLIVQSNGGLMSTATASRLPVRTALSGPAAGVIACAHIAAAAGHANAITCDMGGTSFDVSLVVEGRHASAQQTSIDFGLVVRNPMIEITTIGAGGGSIAWIDRAGLLQIGPQSAGSDPGPACYGAGNMQPTVTDANLVLGRINADRPIGGKLKRLDVEAARAAITASVGKPLGLDPEAAADAVIRVANARMAGAIRLVSIERGHDPRHFALMPFGGGGALHCCALMREVGIRTALVPRFPGVTSAIGCVMADMRNDFVQTVNLSLDGLDTARLAAEMRAHAGRGLELIAGTRATIEAREVRFELDMCYRGQTHSLSVPVPASIAADGSIVGLHEAAVRAAFEKRYREEYKRLLDGIPVLVLSLRTIATGRRPKLDLARMAPEHGKAAARCIVGERAVSLGGRPQTVPIYERLDLAVGERISGPALLEQPDTTILIEPGFTARVDHLGNLVVEVAA